MNDRVSRARNRPEIVPLAQRPEHGFQALLRLAAETADSLPLVRIDEDASRARVFAFVMGGR